MKKVLFSAAAAVLILTSAAARADGTNPAGNQTSLTLPAPDLSSSLMKIINARQSGRAYSAQQIPLQELSNILWAAFGANSHGTRSIPTARNQEDLKVFVLYNQSVWQYDGRKNTLTKISDEDLTPYLAKQDFVLKAPVHLIYAGGNRTAEVHSGSAYENVYLYAAEKGLATVVRGMIDREGLHDKLNLGENETVTYHQTIGYPAE